MISKLEPHEEVYAAMAGEAKCPVCFEYSKDAWLYMCMPCFDAILKLTTSLSDLIGVDHSPNGCRQSSWKFFDENPDVRADVLMIRRAKYGTP